MKASVKMSEPKVEAVVLELDFDEAELFRDALGESKYDSRTFEIYQGLKNAIKDAKEV